VTEHVCEHSVFAMFDYYYTLIYVPSVAHGLKVYSYTTLNGSKTIEEIIKEMKHSCFIHSVCAGLQWQLKCHLSIDLNFLWELLKLLSFLAILVVRHSRLKPLVLLQNMKSSAFTSNTRLQKKHQYRL